ncbi:beta-ketoacyl synthase N-terminal-like domain-containing protein [Micromonospora sp. CA-246542]|uniref:beta-ketoacyl synthase N-terminal-like domain-containing protein n=1 Tax=Micromonospora sp. CA-246542 TaxID=3239959 RepID=UPI003D8E146B
MSNSTPTIAVTGVAIRVPGANDPTTFWRNLLNGTVEMPRTDGDGKPRIRQISRYAEFDAELFGMTDAVAAITDPQHRIFAELAWEALEDAQIDPARFDGRIGVYAGCGADDYRHLQVLPNPAVVRAVGRQQIAVGNDPDFLTTALSYRLGLTGPSITVRTACSTSLVAVHLAARSLLTYECDVAIAGGVTIQLPEDGSYEYSDGDIVSPDGRCRPFTTGAGGTVPASGAGVVVLRRSADTRGARAIILGTAVNNDGADRMSLVAPSPAGQIEVIREALEVAGLAPADVGYVETHGTATALGDQVELTGLNATYGKAGGGACALGAVKANIGHTDTAAGVVGLVKTVLAVQHGVIPPTPAQPGDGEDVDLGSPRFHIARQAQPFEQPRHAAVSSFGLGGTNAHVIVAAADSEPAAPPHWPGQALFALSAASDAALARRAHELADAVEAGVVPVSEHLAAVLWHGRRALRHRWAQGITAPTAAEATGAIVRALRKVSAGQRATPDPRVVLLLPGQGGAATVPGHIDPLFAKHRECLIDAVRAAGGPELSGAEEWPADEPRLRDTSVVQPLLFVNDLALVQTLHDRGIRPAAYLGHSIGELVAATAAGVFPVEDAATAVVHRGRLMAASAPGAMLAVRATPEQALELVGDLPVEVSAVNGPQDLVLGGSADSVAQLQQRCSAHGVNSVLLRTGHAFHTSAMADAAEQFAAVVATLDLRAPESDVVSNVDGQLLDAARATDPRYWARHLRSTVRFGAALDTVVAGAPDLMIEAGPGSALTAMARRAARRAGRSCAATAAGASYLTALGVAWAVGCPVDVPLAATERRVALPAYPFAGVRHWVEAPTPATDAAPPAPAMNAEPHGDDFDTAMVAIWQESFGGPAVTPDDNFFELGGTSLQAAQLIAVVNDRFMIEARLHDLYERSTLHDFTEHARELFTAREAELAALLAELDLDGDVA